MPQSTPICPYCEAKIVANYPTNVLQDMLFCQCQCTRVRLSLRCTSDDTTNAERLEQIWGPHAGVLLEPAQWVKTQPPCFRCQRDELEEQAKMLPTYPINPHTCDRHQQEA